MCAAPIGVGHGASADPGPIAPPAATHSYPTAIRHVVVVLLENAEVTTVLKNGSYEASIANSYAFAPHQFGICHPSAPNYLALTGGLARQCGSDGYTEYTVPSIGSLLQAAGLSYRFYAQSMTTPCNTTNFYPYAVKHNPGVYYGSIVDNSTLCNSVELPGLPHWTNSSVLPNYTFVTPNLKNDGHDTGVAYADRWLKGWLSPFLQMKWFASTVFFIDYDEGSTGAGYRTLSGGHIYLALVSPLTLGEQNFTTANTSQYSVLSTVEWLLGVGSTGNHDGTASFPPMKSAFV
jgi:acid phosphatase